MSFRLVPKSVTLNNLERRNGRYCALSYRIWLSCQALSCSWSWRFLVLVVVFVLTCMVLFNNVWSCIMLLVTKLHKNLIHHENTICAILSCYVTLYTCRYYIVFGKSFYTSHHHVCLICVLRVCYLFYPFRC